MTNDPDADEQLRSLLRRVLQPIEPGRSKHRHTEDQAELDRALAEERITRAVRQDRPRHAPSAPERPERTPFDATEAFSIAKAKKRRRKANTARKGITPRPTAQMGWNPDTDVMIREVLRGGQKDDESV